MEFSIFPKHEDLLKKFVEIRLHTDHKNEELKKTAVQLQKKMAGTLTILWCAETNRPRALEARKIPGARVLN